MNGETIVVEGQVIENLPNTLFRVQLEKSLGEKVILCYLSGKMRKNYMAAKTERINGTLKKECKRSYL